VADWLITGPPQLVELLEKCHSEESHGRIVRTFARCGVERDGGWKEIRVEICHPI
jgi:hypothetical protein